ncbi:Ricin-type beta-trefoil lectin domain protein [Pelomyxa schiedti]|nr:Ricin-type beta-trefoil lectin domain protein [Pelomyxa schiedti]
MAATSGASVRDASGVVYLTPPVLKHKWNLCITCCRNLLAADLNGTSDPYVIIQDKKKKQRTSIKDNTLNPNFIETFKVRGTTAKLIVMDHDTASRDDFLGMVEVNLETMQGCHDEQLLDADGHNIGPRGTILFSVESMAPAVIPAFTFHITTHGLIAPNRPEFQFGTGDFTLEAFFRMTQRGPLIAKKPTEGGPNKGGFLLMVEDNRMSFATDDGSTFSCADTQVSIGDTWHHVAAVRKGAKLRLYLDRNEVKCTRTGASDRALNVNNSHNLMLGWTEQQGQSFRNLQGEIADIRLWNVARSGKLVGCELTVPQAGLVAWWQFATNSLEDSSFNRVTLQWQRRD